MPAAGLMTCTIGLLFFFACLMTMGKRERLSEVPAERGRKRYSKDASFFLTRPCLFSSVGGVKEGNSASRARRVERGDR